MAKALVWLGLCFGFFLRSDIAHAEALLRLQFCLGQPLGMSEAGAIIALRRGYFTEAGLTVEFTPEVAKDRLADLNNRPIGSIGVANVFDFLRARADGQRIVAFAAAYIRNPIVLYVRRDSMIRSVADIRGKSIAYDRGTPTAILFDALLAKNNLSQSSLKLVPNGATVQALQVGQIDVLLGEIGRESHQLDQSKLLFDQLSPSSFGLHLPGTVFFTTEETLRARPDAPRRFLFALGRGWDRIYRKAPEDIAELADGLGLEPRVVSTILDEQRAFLRPSGIRPFELDMFYMKSAASLLVQQRLIKAAPNLAVAFDLDAVKDASKQRW